MLDQLLQLFQGGVDPALGATLANNPEAIIPTLAAQGVAPPSSVGRGTPGQRLGQVFGQPTGPSLEAQEQPATITYPNYGPDPAQMGPAPSPLAVPMPRPRPSSTHFAGAGAPREGTPDAQPQAGAQAGQQGDLLKALQGVKAPATPEAQRVSTPAPVRPNPLPANNNLVQLLVAAMQGNDANKPLYLQNALGAPARR